MCRKTHLLPHLLQFSFTTLAFAACVAGKDDTHGDDPAGTFGSLSATSSDVGDESSEGEDPDPEPQPEPEPEPQPEPESESSGDAEPDPFCGDGTCDATSEDWASCWSDCNAQAPMMPLGELYPTCAGQTVIYDGSPDGDFLWVHGGTLDLMYVDGDTVTQLGGATFQDGGIWIGGEHVGSIGCQQLGGSECVTAIVDAGYQNCSGEASPHGNPPDVPAEIVDFEIIGVGYEYDAAFDYEPCGVACGNGVCDSGEGTALCPDTVHVCESDCV